MHTFHSLPRVREPPDAMSVCYADTSLLDLLGRLINLHNADQASAMQTVPPLCSERASTIQCSFFLKSWLLCVMKNVINFLLT